jgi:hypothetical protein
MNPWRFWEYVTEGGRNLTREWYGQQDASVQAALDNAVLLLQGTDNWTEPEISTFKELTEKHVGLSEIRFSIKAGRWSPQRRFRPVGLYRPQQRDFIFILGCEKKMGGLIYIPLNAFDSALKYKADFENGKGELCEHL